MSLHIYTRSAYPLSRLALEIESGEKITQDDGDVEIDAKICPMSYIEIGPDQNLWYNIAWTKTYVDNTTAEKRDKPKARISN